MFIRSIPTETIEILLFLGQFEIMGRIHLGHGESHDAKQWRSKSQSKNERTGPDDFKDELLDV